MDKDTTFNLIRLYNKSPETYFKFAGERSNYEIMEVLEWIVNN